MFETILLFLGSGAFVGIIGWAVQLNSRVSVIESQWKDLETFLDRIMDSKFEDIARRLDRIERSMNGHLKDKD
jgi:hypothetical protein